MKDLNKSTNTGESGWSRLAFWMDSVQYWSNSKALYGDDNGVYQRSIDSAWRMVNLELCG